MLRCQSKVAVSTKILSFHYFLYFQGTMIGFEIVEASGCTSRREAGYFRLKNIDIEQYLKVDTGNTLTVLGGLHNDTPGKFI